MFKIDKGRVLLDQVISLGKKYCRSETDTKIEIGKLMLGEIKPYNQTKKKKRNKKLSK